jgi:hypothetical protein
MSEEGGEAPRRRVHWDGTINAGHVLQAVVIVAMAGAYWSAHAATQAATEARIATLERDSGAGSRITAALRDNLEAQERRIVALEAASTNTLDRIDREYEERQRAQEVITATLTQHGAALTSIQANVAAIAAAISGSPGARP